MEAAHRWNRVRGSLAPGVAVSLQPDVSAKRKIHYRETGPQVNDELRRDLVGLRTWGVCLGFCYPSALFAHSLMLERHFVQ